MQALHKCHLPAGITSRPTPAPLVSHSCDCRSVAPSCTRTSSRRSATVQNSALLGSSKPRSSAAAPRSRRQTVVVRADSDYYDTLGVPRSADKKTIKSAYRQKARKFHPDVNKEPGAEDMFKKISEAYEVLSDDNKKAIYDQYGEAGLKGGMGGFGGGGQGDFTNPFDLFESFFGGSMGNMGFGGGMGNAAQRSNRPIPGEDEGTELQIDFLDAVFGCEREIEVDRLAGCKTCEGSGVKKGTSSSTCGNCKGQGQVISAVRTPLGMFQQVTTCPRCEGRGTTFTPCETCGGDGRVRESKRISIRIPAGVDNNSRLRVRGEGNAGRRSGPPGDLYVYIRIKEHPELRREGATIHSDVEVSYLDAILGTSIKVTTVDGPVDLKIPAGTQPGTTLLMAKRGVPRLGSPTQRGDHQVHVRVTIPKKVSADERKLLDQLKEAASKTRVGPFTF